MRVRRKYLGSAIVMLFLLVQGVAADSIEQRYEQLKQQYFSLRNTDVNLVKATEWQKLSQSLREFADREHKHQRAAFSLYQESIVEEQLFTKAAYPEAGRAMFLALERIVENYPNHELADDALVRLADLYLLYRQDESAARLSLERVVSKYPQGDLHEAAREKLARLDEVGNVEESGPNLDLGQGISSGPLVFIDPGHGGEDFGAVGQGGLLEKDVVLAVALELERLLLSRKTVRVQLSRRTDVFVPLAVRMEQANSAQADLFISLHVNASVRSNASGFELYYLDNANDAASRKLAERENASLSFGGETAGDLSFMLSDLIQRGKHPQSVHMAEVLSRSLRRHLTERWPDVRFLGVKSAPFYVLIGAHMPCVLAELFFIDHSIDGVRLARRDFRSDLASGLAAGLTATIAELD